jgi:hypothetical protein
MRVGQGNDLATLLAAKHPQVLASWHPTKNGDLLPTDITHGTERKVWWTGPCDHDWQDRPSTRIKQATCPYCDNRRVGYGNDLASLLPELAAEWHSTKNGTLRAEQVVPGSGRRVWWQCLKGHAWRTRVVSRAREGTGCWQCHPQAVSKREISLFAELRAVLGNAIQPDATITTRGGRAVHFDMAITTTAGVVLLDYDGAYWHRDAERRDIWKSRQGLRAGHRVLRVRERPLPDISDAWVIWTTAREPVHLLTGRVLTALRHDLLPEQQPAVDAYIRSTAPVASATARRLHKEAEKRATRRPTFRNTRALPEPGTSLGDLHPHLIDQWYPGNNLTPFDYRSTSNAPVDWVCSKGHRWPATIDNRVKGTGCPGCRGRWRHLHQEDSARQRWEKEQASRAVRKDSPSRRKQSVPEPGRSLGDLHPHLVGEWDPQNSLRAFDYRPRSSEVVIWRCAAGHRWPALVANRTNGSGCPGCQGKLSFLLDC